MGKAKSKTGRSCYVCGATENLATIVSWARRNDGEFVDICLRGDHFAEVGKPPLRVVDALTGMPVDIT